MGLDMYLVANGYLSQYDAVDVEKATEIKKLYAGLPERVRVQEVAFEVGYWRKANAVHRWFVDNVQDGVDNCRKYYVSKEKLLNLKQICQNVLANPALAETLLPPSTGFFFGSDALDEHYFDVLRYTIEVCKDALTMVEEGFYVEYQSSW